jgi:hypothetical protein
VVLRHADEEELHEALPRGRLHRVELGLGEHARHVGVVGVVVPDVGRVALTRALEGGLVLLEPAVDELDLALLRDVHALGEQPQVLPARPVGHQRGHLQRLLVVGAHALEERSVVRRERRPELQVVRGLDEDRVRLARRTCLQVADVRIERGGRLLRRRAAGQCRRRHDGGQQSGPAASAHPIPFVRRSGDGACPRRPSAPR